jgi:hypothetical protein
MKLLKDVMSRGMDEWVYNTSYETFADEMGQAVAHSIKRQYVFEETHNPVLRLSSLGKTPAFELCAKKVGLLKQSGKHTVSEQHRLLFSIGDYVECWLRFTLKRLGYTILEEQTDVSWNGVGGHIDFLVSSPDGSIHLLECKSANDYYFTQVKKGIGDERGYLTQLLTYDECMREKYPDLQSHWVFVNKNTSELQVIDLESIPKAKRTATLKRAKSVVKAFEKCQTADDIYKYTQPPPPSIEQTRTGVLKYWEDGTPKMYVPCSIANPDLCYITESRKTDYGKARLYVLDYNYPEHLQKHKPNIIEQALAHNGG